MRMENTYGTEIVNQQETGEHFSRWHNNETIPTDNEQQSGTHSKQDLANALEVDIRKPTDTLAESDDSSKSGHLSKTRRNTETIACTKLNNSFN